VYRTCGRNSQFGTSWSDFYVHCRLRARPERQFHEWPRTKLCPLVLHIEIVAWQRAVELVTHVYRVTKTFPNDERFGLTSQLRRAAVSVPSNIAEGQGRFSRGEFKQFLGHARGSLLEMETQITIATNLGYLDSRESIPARPLFSIRWILNGLIGSLVACLEDWELATEH